MNLQKTITPIDNSIYLERELASDSKINSVIERPRQVLKFGKTHLLMTELILLINSSIT